MAPGPVGGDAGDARQRYATAWRATLAAMKGGDSISGHERNMAFLNRPAPALPGGRGFADISAPSGLDFDDDARGLALVDWDRDGDLDLWLRNRSAPSLRLMINRASEHGRAGGFIALRLEGTAANRDAIGARVEVGLDDGSVLVRELAAGSGFLSQSSKWLHFGLGSGAKVRAVAVRWPWGERETFAGVEADGWWRLVQGGGIAERVAVTPQEVALPSGPQPIGVPDSGRTLLAVGAMLPDVGYRDASGASRQLADGGGPRLVTFWASWCPNCETELEALAAGKEAMVAAGIDLLAVNVDADVEGPQATAGEVLAHLEGLGVSFAWGIGEPGILLKVKHLEHALLDRDTELALPYSCLLDADGEVAAFYRGPVDLARVAADAALLSGPEDGRRAAIVGFGGRAFSAAIPRDGRLAELGIRFQERFPLEAIRYLEMSLPTGRVDWQGHPVARRIAGVRYVVGLAALGEGRNAEAATHFKESIRYRPDLLDARLNLSVALFRQGGAAEAKAELEALLEIDPNHAGALANLRVIIGHLGTHQP